MYLLLIVGVLALWIWVCSSQRPSHIKNSKKTNYSNVSEETYDEEFEKQFITIEAAINLEQKEEKERIYDGVKRYSKLFNESKKILEKNIKNKVDDGIRYSVKLKSLKEQAYDCYKNNEDKSFKNKLLSYIDSKGFKDSDVYKSAGISRQVFNNIINIKGYKPERETVFRLVLALMLTVEETEDLLKSLGYFFSDYWIEDIYIKLCLENKVYNVDKIFREIKAMDQKEYEEKIKKSIEN